MLLLCYYIPLDQYVVYYIIIIKNLFGKLNSFLQTYVI